MPLTFPVNPTAGQLYIAPSGATWRASAVDATTTMRWQRLTSDMSLFLRETLYFSPNEGQVITLPSHKDVAVYLNAASSLAQVDFIFPTAPVDGQMVVIRILPYPDVSFGVRLFFNGPNGGASMPRFYTGEIYTYQFIASIASWLAL